MTVDRNVAELARQLKRLNKQARKQRHAARKGAACQVEGPGELLAVVTRGGRVVIVEPLPKGGGQGQKVSTPPCLSRRRPATLSGSSQPFRRVQEAVKGLPAAFLVQPGSPWPCRSTWPPCLARRATRPKTEASVPPQTRMDAHSPAPGTGGTAIYIWIGSK